MTFDIIDRIDNASLSGMGLMLVMLASFLVGAISMRLALELDAKALWAVIRRSKNTTEEPDDGGEA